MSRPAPTDMADVTDADMADVTDADAADAADGDAWKIDELAHRSGTTVDTIRFYQRDGLLPPARREGRAGLYGPVHLRRIEQIHDLQARHFNLAAVKALLIDTRMDVINAIFGADDPTVSRVELLAAAGIDHALAERLTSIGLLADPAESGRTGYDRADIEMLTTITRMISLGLPEDVVLFLAGMYAEQFASMQTRVAAVFSGEGELDWPEQERAAFLDGLGNRVADLIGMTTQLLNYAHQATVRRMTVATWMGAEDET